MACPQAISSATFHYSAYLKSVYTNSPISPDSKWPPTPSKEYIQLAVVEGKKCRDEYIGHTLQGNVKHLLEKRKNIAIEQILDPCKGQEGKKLILIEGAPGIGKSTLAWELCRKWEKFPNMKDFKLVILLRLRERKVQKIAEISDLFVSYESEDKGSLKSEITKTHGEGVLFVLDGFDELPVALQQEGFLVELIKKTVLPNSTVVVTSRPSATANLLTSCRPLIRKHYYRNLGLYPSKCGSICHQYILFRPCSIEGFYEVYFSFRESSYQ